VTVAYLGLGSNIGDRISNLRGAVRLIGEIEEVKVLKASSVYETEPVGYVDQPNFLNCAIEIDTGLSPKELLKQTSEIEIKLKRIRSIRWGPRTIDIDILVFDDIEVNEPDLEIPHPRICERAFVIEPLLELSPDIEIRGLGKLKECKENVADQKIKKLAAADIGDIISK
jgi:2-amino-4-hydroxy-6-hydroxymethyldihydropteridine diphosphokinase